MRGRCVAGLRVDRKGWVRPIAQNTDHGQLYSTHYRLNDDTDPEVLDVIGLDLAAHRPVPGQPENWAIGDKRWILVARPSGPNLHGILRSALELGPSLLGSFDKRISANLAVQAHASLALIAPSNMRWSIGRDLRGRPQPRVLFELNGQPYNLPITDPAWTSRIVLRRSQLEGGPRPQEPIGIPRASKVLLTVSLSEVLDGYCYKLAAGIVVIQDF
jgi:hypothetical protein